MKVLCVGYRSWALKIYHNLKKTSKHDFMIIDKKEKLSTKKIYNFKPNLILFYGWSWKIDEEIIDNFNCIMLHPSALPKYRGGSPIQNQIIRGVLSSKVTIFLMNKKIDSGDIIASEYLSLKGSLKEIFLRMSEIGERLTKKFVLKKSLKLKSQDDSKASYFKRLKPEDSEITINDLKNQNAKYLHNKIRMLDDPYPNAFIKTSDGKKLILKKVEIK